MKYGFSEEEFWPVLIPCKLGKFNSLTFDLDEAFYEEYVYRLNAFIEYRDKLSKMDGKYKYESK